MWYTKDICGFYDFQFDTRMEEESFQAVVNDCIAIADTAKPSASCDYHELEAWASIVWHGLVARAQEMSMVGIRLRLYFGL